MGSIDGEIYIDFSPYFVIHKDGLFKRLKSPEFAPPSEDPEKPVLSKDIVIEQEKGLSIRLYKPKRTSQDEKLPVVVYVHGGAFCLGSASSPTFHNFVNSLVEKANVIAASVDYRVAPENPLPCVYDDCYKAFQWVLSHAGGEGPEKWLTDHADFQRLFVGGDSAGANIAHDLAIRAGETVLKGANLNGLFLVHPFFGAKEEDRLYKFLCPTSSGRDDDPRLNPAVDPRLPGMKVKRVLFCLAEKDFLKGRGKGYFDALVKSEWTGEAEIMESEGEGHGFHLFKPSCEKAVELISRLAAFLN